MPRQARKESGTGIYHVMLRGINRQDIFEEAEDYLPDVEPHTPVAAGEPRGLNEASSGIQTVLPLVAVMSYYTDKFDIVKRFNQTIFRMLSETDSLKDFRPQMNIGEIPHRRVNFLIEEPELSLDPESQTHLIDFMVGRCFSKKGDDMSDYTVMLATHSPYIVNYLNLLIARSKKGVDGGVDYNDVNAYYMDKGRCYTLRTGAKSGDWYFPRGWFAIL